MRMLIFSKRTFKELVRDPLTLAFGIGFPVVLLLLMSLMSRNIPEMPEMFSIGYLAPAMTVFGLSFIALFSGMLIAGDRESSFLARLFASPMLASDYILGYTLPLLITSLIQCAVCFGVAAVLGFKLTLNVLLCLAVSLPTALLFVSFGILFGATLTYKQVGGVSSILVNVAAWLSGTWFSLELIGGTFKKIGYALPFAHAVDMARAACNGDYAQIMPHMWWVLGWAVVVLALGTWLFGRKMKS